MWYRALAFAALCLWPASSFGALAEDAVSSANCSGCSSLTWAHTTSGANRCLLVNATVYDADDFLNVATYNAVNAPVVVGSLAYSAPHNAAGFMLAAPATGSNSVNLTTGPSSATELTGAAISFTGCDQTTPAGTPAVATGNSTTPSVTVSSAAGEIVVDNLSILHSGTLTVGAGQTEKWNAIASGFTKYAGSSEPGAGSNTMSWLNSTAQTWALSGIPVRPVSVGGGSGTGLRMRMRGR